MIRITAITILAAGFMVAGCAANSPSSNRQAESDHSSHQTMRNMASEAANSHDQAVAVIHPTQGHHVHGTVRFTPVNGGLRIVADLQGLPPNSTHGFHIHQFGDCSAPDASSAGGHYNPTDQPHAAPHAAHHHAGDLGNIQSDADGNAHLDLTVNDITVDGQTNPIIGRAVIVHEKADDLKSQPSGAAGDRIGCGVIGLAKNK